jgi:stigma-specific protein Stig1
MSERLSLLGLLICALAGCPNGAGITCPNGQSFCNGQCIVTSGDPKNCGGCNQVCASGTFCAGSTCVPGCPPPLAVCSAQCVDEQNDPANCGSCGNACAAEFFCVGGKCIFGCPLTKCMNNTLCVDTNVDVNNCGFCGNACTINNICCSGHCVNFSTNLNCGGCVPCAMGTSCINMGAGYVCIAG